METNRWKIVFVEALSVAGEPDETTDAFLLRRSFDPNCDTTTSNLTASSQNVMIQDPSDTDEDDVVTNETFLTLKDDNRGRDTDEEEDSTPPVSQDLYPVSSPRSTLSDEVFSDEIDDGLASESADVALSDQVSEDSPPRRPPICQQYFGSLSVDEEDRWADDPYPPQVPEVPDVPFSPHTQQGYFGPSGERRLLPLWEAESNTFTTESISSRTSWFQEHYPDWTTSGSETPSEPDSDSQRLPDTMERYSVCSNATVTTPPVKMFLRDRYTRGKSDFSRNT